METRTEPRQRRSRDKYERVLAAAAALLEEMPYEMIGTRLIANRADVSVGTLYRFFVDKQAIVDALAQHWLDRLVEVMDEQLAELPPDPVALIDRLIDAYTLFWRAEPGFRKAWSWVSVEPGAAHSNDVQLIDRLHAALTSHYGIPDEPALGPRLELAIGVAEHLLNLAFKQDPHGDPEVLAELKILLARYLGLA